MQLLVNEINNKEKQLKALESRIDLSADFKEFLIEKIKRENNEIASLCCAIDSISPSCTPQQQSEFSEKQRKAISLLLENEKVLDNVYRLANKLGEEHA